MPKNRIIIALGLLVALLPLLGFPRLWESFFQVATGFSIILLSVWSNIDKRLTLKAKAQKRQAHKKRVAEIEAQKNTEEVLIRPEEHI
ncbi:MAG: hypothetical protein A3B03_03690 [Candidatus Zambryskibacteria bacterium RIFCSPLOWO2_01_FULL_42_41]|nr:MAG: hypothetical protein A2829_01025 [Candidatus Zambryskibacteria bacterium RIFCSPHIGHO2_01_FULL_43_60]OHB03869.1 MAG: hypothetical protein A3B03_03690 [Candidatus Zambryskibacteria bacterium RIFCSPLOWO2_01_FULL_42_41]